MGNGIICRIRDGFNFKTFLNSLRDFGGRKRYV
jgi:hypothetical protein